MSDWHRAAFPNEASAQDRCALPDHPQERRVSVPCLAIKCTPPGEKHKVLWAGVSRSPCYNPDELAETMPLMGRKVFTCWLGRRECMKAITAEDV